MKTPELYEFLIKRDCFGNIYSQLPFIRCKDCKYFDKGIDEDGNIFYKCIGSNRSYGGTTAEWYCADGELAD